MGDTHLLNLALAGIGISAGTAIVIAAAIIGIAALRLHFTMRTTSAVTTSTVTTSAVTTGAPTTAPIAAPAMATTAPRERQAA